MSQLNNHISQLREDFMKGELSEDAIEKIPFIQFEKWMKEAIDSNVNEVQAFNLATVNKDNKPSARIVYVREFTDNQFYFYTNFQSRKAMEIDVNNAVAMTFFWPELERQIRIEGTIDVAHKDNSDAYFNQRPRASQIGAWSSPQSKVIANRIELEKLVNNTTLRFENNPIERPDFWGGYVITAHYYEFWQGRKSRLHDRIIYTKDNNTWKIDRLAP